MSPCIW